jgi:putative PIN family toxin of toxin-antitoxin system
MRVVLDTNVWLASILSTRGTCAAVFENCVRNHVILISEFVLHKFRGHLLGKFRKSDEETDRILNLARMTSEMVAPAPLAAPVCRDPDGDWILALAVSGRADFLVTGDKDLLVLHPFREISIVSPAAFTALDEDFRRPETHN